MEDHGGRVFKHTGDGLGGVFGNVPDAVACAVTAQRGLAAADAGSWQYVEELATAPEGLAVRHPLRAAHPQVSAIRHPPPDDRKQPHAHTSVIGPLRGRRLTRGARHHERDVDRPC